jgi:tetratricopeptide (TPR) repeat protein
LIASAHGISPEQVITFLWKLKGEALAALGETEKACHLLRAALENAERTGERFILWRLHISLAQLYHAMKRRTSAQEEFSAAEELIDELAATIPDEALKCSFLKGAYHTLSTPR